MSALVAIVGGGPVGLYLALVLLREGIEPRVFERNERAASGSRSIGVHPPSIELFEEIGIAEAFLAEAVQVRRGLAFGERGAVGEVSFDRCPGRYRFVATLEQHRTEGVLRRALLARAPHALVGGVAVTHVREERDGATLVLKTADGRVEEERFAAVVGADGRRSGVRTSMRATFDGDAYEGEYAMADAPDTTSFGEAAAVFLTARGLVESFPLPARRRRWVVRRASSDALRPSRAEIAELVGERAGIVLDPASMDEPSGFRAERRLASTLAKGRIALVGDAAHVVSPIGGQGMNLGWLGARSVARALVDSVGRRRAPGDALEADARVRRAQANVAARRAELNMWIGRPTQASRPRELLLGALLALPTAHLLARAFTMRGLAMGL